MSKVFTPAQRGMNLLDRPCGEEGNRTPDPLLAKQVLYQLSYSPACRRGFRLPSRTEVRIPGFEPGTPALSELCSSQLSYIRVAIEPD